MAAVLDGLHLWMAWWLADVHKHARHMIESAVMDICDWDGSIVHVVT